MVFLETLRALLEPRRLVPIALVAAAMLSAEWLGSGSSAAVLLDLVLIVSFVLISPALHRVTAVSGDVSHGRQLLSWSLNMIAAGLIVGAVAVLGPPLLGIRWTYIAEPGSLGLLIALFLVGGWGLGRDIDLALGLEHETARAERLAVDAEHAQILALRAQLDPHFLFNTLNAIAEWCREDPIVAERAMLQLAGVLRTIFDALKTPTWTLGHEVTLIEQLAELYSVRDPSRYVFQIEIDERAREVITPALVLLPLFENAIKHGPAAGHAGIVSLVARRANEQTIIEIRNAGPFLGRREGGEGVSMVERRLALTYGDRARLAIEAQGEETVARAHLPSDAPSPRSAS